MSLEQQNHLRYRKRLRFYQAMSSTSAIHYGAGERMRRSKGGGGGEVYGAKLHGAIEKARRILDEASKKAESVFISGFCPLKN